jgi:PTH1 family peptidyl-tRNA hydrolase
LLRVPANAETTNPSPASNASGPPDATSEVRERERRIIVIGLGNSGESCAGTRHNVGQRTLDVLAARFGGTWTNEAGLASVLKARFEGHAFVLVKLLSLMNDSGTALRTLATRLGFTLDDCILVHDDLDLPLGRVRVRHRGGDGGHRGIQSIIQAFQDDKVRRVKIGIGKPATGQSVADFVLSLFKSEELPTVDAATLVGAERVLEVVRESASSSDIPRVERQTAETTNVESS